MLKLRFPQATTCRECGERFWGPRGGAGPRSLSVAAARPPVWPVIALLTRPYAHTSFPSQPAFRIFVDFPLLDQIDAQLADELMPLSVELLSPADWQRRRRLPLAGRLPWSLTVTVPLPWLGGRA
jgi:hypothetical protein